MLRLQKGLVNSVYSFLFSDFLEKHGMAGGEFCHMRSQKRKENSEISLEEKLLDGDLARGIGLSG